MSEQEVRNKLAAIAGMPNQDNRVPAYKDLLLAAAKNVNTIRAVLEHCKIYLPFE